MGCCGSLEDGIGEFVTALNVVDASLPFLVGLDLSGASLDDACVLLLSNPEFIIIITNFCIA